MGGALGNSFYIGLLNNFPGQSNSTSAQKLAVVDVTTIPPIFSKFIDIAPTEDKLIIHYISFFRMAFL